MWVETLDGTLVNTDRISIIKTEKPYLNFIREYSIHVMVDGY